MYHHHGEKGVVRPAYARDLFFLSVIFRPLRVGTARNLTNPSATDPRPAKASSFSSRKSAIDSDAPSTCLVN